MNRSAALVGVYPARVIAIAPGTATKVKRLRPSMVTTQLRAVVGETNWALIWYCPTETTRQIRSLTPTL
jgi:hypothetical protein